MMKKKLIEREIHYGIIRIDKRHRDEFPAEGTPIIVEDNTGRRVSTHMHRMVGRIDGLTEMHRVNHAYGNMTIELKYVGNNRCVLTYVHG